MYFDRLAAGHFLCVLLCVLLWTPAAWAQGPRLMIGNLAVDALPFSVFLMPGESLPIAPRGAPQQVWQLSLQGQTLATDGEGRWQLQAPQTPGLYAVSVRDQRGVEHGVLNVFVKVPQESVVDDHLNGYRIGPPPPGDARFPEIYRAPAGFIEVTPENVDTKLTPHFTLGQFLCKQKSGWPRYVVIQEPLLALLEGLLQAVREAGYPAETFGVISAYRTPWYNKRIGNVANSRHVYGDAMDLFVDVDRDGRLDDLNHDGDTDFSDVQVLYDIVEAYKQKPANAHLLGGIGRYRPTSRHGGFVHVDTRGRRARW